MTEPEFQCSIYEIVEIIGSHCGHTSNACEPISVSQSVYLSVSLSVCLSICQSVCVSVSQSVCLSMWLSICQFISLSVGLSALLYFPIKLQKNSLSWWCLLMGVVQYFHKEIKHFRGQCSLSWLPAAVF